MFQAFPQCLVFLCRGYQQDQLDQQYQVNLEDHRDLLDRCFRAAQQSPGFHERLFVPINHSDQLDLERQKHLAAQLYLKILYHPLHPSIQVGLCCPWHHFGQDYQRSQLYQQCRIGLLRRLCLVCHSALQIRVDLADLASPEGRYGQLRRPVH